MRGHQRGGGGGGGGKGEGALTAREREANGVWLEQVELKSEHSPDSPVAASP